MDSFYSFFKKVLLNEKGQEERGSYIYGFSGKNSHLKQASHYGPKNGPLNFGYTVRIFLKFYSMKGVKKYNGTYIVSLKKILIWGKWAILGLKMAHPHNFGSTLRIFFFLKFCIMRRVKKYMELIYMVFLVKILIWGKWIILAGK